MTDTIAPWVREILRCPVCHATLEDAKNGDADELVCTGNCADGKRRAYRFDGGIPVLLADEARIID